MTLSVRLWIFWMRRMGAGKRSVRDLSGSVRTTGRSQIFYEMADEKSCKKLEHYLATGEIGLSGNYLNMTELVSRPAPG